MTADEVMKAIEEMENGERIKLLNELLMIRCQARPEFCRKFGRKIVN